MRAHNAESLVITPMRHHWLTSPALSKNLVSATIMRMKLPALTVSSHILADTAFMDEGDCEYANSLPVGDVSTSPMVMMMYLQTATKR